MITITKEQLIEDLKASTQNASGMFEISEDTICALMYMLTTPPSPASVPGEIQKLKDGSGFKYVKDGVHYSVNYANGWNQCLAAMLQGAEPVSNTYTLPANSFTDEELEGMAHGDNPQANAYRELLAFRRNSPAIPDDVRRMDWLVSKTVDVREPMVYGSHSLFWSQTITDEDDDYHATKLREQIDAAMAAENAAAPQQEVMK